MNEQIKKMRIGKPNFVFLKTPIGKTHNNSSKMVKWINDDTEVKAFNCWVCKKYASSRQMKLLKVQQNTIKNYMNRHLKVISNKHKKFLTIKISPKGGLTRNDLYDKVCMVRLI